jgi:hypothetical protein
LNALADYESELVFLAGLCVYAHIRQYADGGNEDIDGVRRKFEVDARLKPTSLRNDIVEVEFSAFGCRRSRDLGNLVYKRSPKDAPIKALESVPGEAGLRSLRLAVK